MESDKIFKSLDARFTWENDISLLPKQHDRSSLVDPNRKFWFRRLSHKIVGWLKQLEALNGSILIATHRGRFKGIPDYHDRRPMQYGVLFVHEIHVFSGQVLLLRLAAEEHND